MERKGDGDRMSLKDRFRLDYLPGQTPEQAIDFVHEIVRTQQCAFNAQHVQDTYEMMVYVAGQLDLKVWDTVYHCGAGDIILLPPGTPHSGHRYDCLLERYTVLLGPAAMDVFGGMGERLRGTFLPDDGSYLLRLPPDWFSEVTKTLAAADHALHSPIAGLSHIEAFSAVLHVLLLLVRYQTEKEGASAPSQVFARVIAYIESDYASLHSAEEVCQTFGISRSGLWRLFTSQLGQTPSAYLRQVRLNNARLLLERGASVTEAAMEVGFGDCSHFIRLFREAFGMTPLRYKNSRGAAQPTISKTEGQRSI